MNAQKPSRFSITPHLIILGLGLVGLYLSSLYSFLLFHSAAELFSIVVAFSIFIIGWAARRALNNGYLLFLGIAFLFIAGLDTVHTLAYKGMGVFPEFDANLSTQLWIATRYLQSFALLAAPLFLHRDLKPGRVFAGFIAATSLLLLTIFNGTFPDCYIEGVGLTPFKVISEYVISAILLASMGLLWKHRHAFDSTVLRWLMVSIALSILSELTFTNYVSVYGFANLLGHLFKIVAFYALFQAIVETGFYRPFDLLLRNLKLNEEALRLAQAELEGRVEQRTQQLAQTNAELRSEISERQRIGAELREVQRRLMDSKEEERLSLARELHDGPLQDLIAAGFMLQQVSLEAPEKQLEELVSIQELISQVSRTLRSVCSELRPHALTSFGLEKAIQAHAADFQAKHPELALHLELIPDPYKLPEQTRLALFRIYQQSLNNILRHARASQVTVSFSMENQALVLEVQDDGQGFNVPKGWIDFVREGHLGLAGISERAEAVGGKMEVISHPGEGTRVQVVVPLQEPNGVPALKPEESWLAR